MAAPTLWLRNRATRTALLAGILLVSVIPAKAQSFGMEARMGVTYLRAYGGSGVGPDVGIAVRLPGNVFGTRARVGLAMSAADVSMAGAVGPLVDGDDRRLQLVVADVGLEWLVTPRIQVNVAGVLGRIESAVPSLAAVTHAGVRPANRPGDVRGTVVGVEAGVGWALVPGLFLDFVGAGFRQRAYANDPILMPAFRLGLLVVPEL